MGFRWLRYIKSPGNINYGEKKGIIIKKESEGGITIDMLAAAASCGSR